MKALPGGHGKASGDAQASAKDERALASLGYLYALKAIRPEKTIIAVRISTHAATLRERRLRRPRTAWSLQRLA